MKTAVIVVPGFGCREIGRGVEILKMCLLNGLGKSVASEGEDCRTAGLTGTQIIVKVDGEAVDVDLFEAFWGDLIPNLAGESSPLRKVFMGARVLWYWIVSRVWSELRGNKYLIGGMIGSSLLILAWYVGVVPAAVAAFVAQIDPESQSGVLKQASELAGGIEKLWWFAAIVSLLVVMLPVHQVVDLANFTMVYLRDLPATPGSESLRHRIHNRVEGVVRAIAEDPAYDKVLVASHSFGTMVAIDLMSRINLGSQTVGMLTIASPARVLAARDHRLARQVLRPPLPDAVRFWVDVHSGKDWLCSAVPMPDGTPGFESRLVNLPVTTLDSVTGDSHTAYFRDETVARIILETIMR